MIIQDMKISKSITLLVAAVVGGMGVVMALTNPSQSSYEEYATVQLTEYVKDEVCQDAPKILGNFLARSCDELLDSSHPAIQKIISANTQRKNLIFFSIYITDLSVSSSIPSYHFESVGVLQKFYTYNAEER